MVPGEKTLQPGARSVEDGRLLRALHPDRETRGYSQKDAVCATRKSVDNGILLQCPSAPRIELRTAFLTRSSVTGGPDLTLPACQRPRRLSPHTVDIRGRSASQSSSAAATKMVGKITSLIVAQPNLSSSWPEENELRAMLPKIRKSLNA